jgi:hypothetical protein
MDSIDASIGLEPILQILAQYHKSGVLHARMSHLPGLREAGTCSIDLTGGKVVACFIQSERGEWRSLPVKMVIRFDRDKGPFEWKFFAQQAEVAATKKPEPPSSAQTQKLPVTYIPRGDDIPQAVAYFNVDALTNLSPAWKRVLRMTYAMVNGRRTINEIETLVPLPKGAVYQAIAALVAMHVVVIHPH